MSTQAIFSYLDKSSASDWVFDIQVGRDKLSLVIRFHVLSVLGERLEAGTTPVILIVEFSCYHIHALVVVFEPGLLSLWEGLGVRKLSVSCCLIGECVRPQSIVRRHQLGFVLKGPCLHVAKAVT